MYKVLIVTYAVYGNNGVHSLIVSFDAYEQAIKAIQNINGREMPDNRSVRNYAVGLF